jgi:flagellin-specific chaperone FliS
MRNRVLRPLCKPFIVMTLIALVFLADAARAQQTPATSAEHESKAGPVVRSFGAEGGYRTEVKSETQGTLSPDDRRQISLLAAQVFQHVDKARRALDADDTKQARKEVDKGREAIRAIRAMQPRTNVHTRTTAPDGKVIYEDEREVQEDRVPLFEGMLHARTLAPIREAQSDASRVAGVRVVASETLSTEVTADIDFVEAQLGRAAKALDDKKTEDAAGALVVAQVRGVEFRYTKEDAPLAEARDALWLAKRALEENNTTQAQANLGVARLRLEVYRQVLPEGKRQDVTQMLSEVDQLESKLRREVNQPASHAERAKQGSAVTQWWERLDGWFKRGF